MTKGETLKLSVRNPDAAQVEFRFGGTESKSLPAAKNGNYFTLEESSATWQAGSYVWQAWATMADSSVLIIARGSFELESGLCVGDSRTSARKMVEMIETMMAGNASEGVRRYKINNRELERYSVDELLKLLSYWKAQTKKEERMAAGLSVLGPRIAVRF